MATHKKHRAPDGRRQKAFDAKLAAQFDAIKADKYEGDNETLSRLLDCWQKAHPAKGAKK